MSTPQCLNCRKYMIRPNGTFWRCLNCGVVLSPEGVRQVKDECHWLLERPGKAPVIPYFSGFTQSGFSETLSPDRALKFGTKEEAEAFIKRNGLIDWEATEHMWCAPLVSPRNNHYEK